MADGANEGSAAMRGSTLAHVAFLDATVNYMLRSGESAESIVVALAKEKARLTERLVEIESTWPFKMGIMLAALKRQQANIRRWLETGIPADADESRAIAEQIDAAIKTAEDGR